MEKCNLKSNANGSVTDIGIWYVNYNTEKMFQSNFGTGIPIKYRSLMPDGSWGIPCSDNIEVIDFYLEKLAEAKIDFILFDITNGGLTEKIHDYGWDDRGEDYGNRYIVKNAKLVCKRIAKWNKEHDWKIKYAVAVGAYMQIRGARHNGKEWVKPDCDIDIGTCVEWQAEAVYKEFFMNEEFGGDNHYQLDGKPLLIIHDWGENVLIVPHGWNNYKGDRTYGDKFTVRNGQGGEGGTYGWNTRYGTLPDPEVECICAGHSCAHSTVPAIFRNKGRYYKKGWQVVLETRPRIVMIAGLNDYNERSAIFPTDSSQCDFPGEEKWYNEKGELDPYLYWNITVDSIKQLRKLNGEKTI